MGVSLNPEETLKIYRSIFHNSLDAVLISNPSKTDDQIVYSNPAAVKLFGYSEEELNRMGWDSILDRRDPKLIQFLTKLKDNGTSREELVFKKKDGSRFPGEIAANQIDENEQIMNIAVVKDISWRKTAEHILIQNQKKFKYQAMLLNKVNDAVLGLDKYFRINYWNHGAEEIFGYNESEVIGKDPFEIIKPNNDLNETQKIMEELVESGTSKTVLTTLTKQGMEIIVEQNFTRIGGVTGENKGYMAVYHDITEKKQTLDKLKTNEKRYRMILNNLQDGFFRLDNHGTIIMASPSLAKIYGFNSIHELLGLQASVLYKNIDAETIIKEIHKQGKLENYEVKGIRNDGTTQWVSLNAQYIYDDQKQIQGIDGFVRDINLKKSTEKALKSSEERYSKILENIPDTYIRADNDGRIILANRAAARLYGYDSPEEMIGKEASSLYKNPEERYLVMNILRKYGNVENNEIEGVRLDNKPFIASENVQYFYNEKNEILGTELLVRDVTKIKKAELLNRELLEKEKRLSKQLQKSNNELKSMAEELSNANLELKNLTHDLTNSNKELNMNQKILRRINRSLSESKEMFLKAFHSNPAGMTLADDEGRWIDVNKSFVELMGYSRNEMIGHTSEELGMIMRTERDSYLSKSQIDGRLQNQEIEAQTKDGNKRIIISSTEAIKVGEKGRFISFIYDITERKKSELQIKRNQKLLTSINQLFHEALKHETEKEVVNKFLYAAETLTGSEFGFFGEVNDKGKLDDVALNHSDPKFQTTKTMDQFKNMNLDGYWGRTVKEGKSQIINDPYNHSSSNKLPDGHPIIETFMGVPLKHGEMTMGMIALANKKGGYSSEDLLDIESLSRAFLEILLRKRAEIQINQAMKKLEKSNTELEQFAYITSHDLREPLRMITSFLQLLQRRYNDKLDKDANEFIGFAVEGAKRLDNMTNDLLLYSKLNSKKRHIAPINYEDSLKIAILNLKVPIDENNAVITHDPLPTVEGDEKLTVQLFQNLIGNGIKYRSSKNPIIHVSAKLEKNQYLFSVTDNGIGINKQHLKKIFTIFQRLHTHEEYDGTGIGLAICKKIVEQQGGTIWAESEPDQGTTFYFTVPLQNMMK